MRIEQTQKQIYLESFLKENSLKQLARQNSLQLNKEGISVSSAEAQIIKLFAAMIKPQKIVEIGTLTGLSALYLAESFFELSLLSKIQHFHLWTLEKDPRHAQLASEVLQKYQSQQPHLQTEVLQGDAKEELEKLSAKGPFCIIFIDANKAAYMDYLLWAEKNLRQGGLIIADNVFLSGAVWNSSDDSAKKFSAKQVKVMQDFNQRLMSSEDYLSALVPTEEGLIVAVKK